MSNWGPLKNYCRTSHSLKSQLHRCQQEALLATCNFADIPIRFGNHGFISCQTKRPLESISRTAATETTDLYENRTFSQSMLKSQLHLHPNGCNNVWITFTILTANSAPVFWGVNCNYLTSGGTGSNARPWPSHKEVHGQGSTNLLYIRACASEEQKTKKNLKQTSQYQYYC